MTGFWQCFTFGERGNKAVNFYALIEFYTYYHLREQGFTPYQIKQFRSFLKEELKVPYPFASVKISTQIDEKNRKNGQIFYEYLGQLLRADGKQQIIIKPFIEPFLKKIEFGKDSLAKRYFPLDKTKSVVVDPLRQFGQPTINGTTIQTAAVYNLYKAGESKKNICNLYDVSMKQVSDAILYYKRSA
jgi:uncharacterized protein (DUF433 family)